MTEADMCLEAARKAFPNDEKMRVAYMLGFNEGYDRTNEQPKIDLEKELEPGGIIISAGKETVDTPENTLREKVN